VLRVAFPDNTPIRERAVRTGTGKADLVQARLNKFRERAAVCYQVSGIWLMLACSGIWLMSCSPASLGLAGAGVAARGGVRETYNNGRDPNIADTTDDLPRPWSGLKQPLNTLPTGPLLTRLLMAGCRAVPVQYSGSVTLFVPERLGAGKRALWGTGTTDLGIGGEVPRLLGRDRCPALAIDPLGPAVCYQVSELVH
jgi:hypothetical protein